MNPWIAKAVILAASVVMVAIRAPHGQRSRGVRIVKNRKGRQEVILLTLAMLGFFVPLVWVASPVFSFAEYPLRLGPLIAGVVCFVVGLWLFFRSHADLGTNWSITLQVREDHRLITHGTYRCVRHPMYLALAATCLLATPALPHPGSGIVVDRLGQIYFLDTGAGLWKIDTQGKLIRVGGPAFHWMTIDADDRFAGIRLPSGSAGEITRVGSSPTLLVASDFPIAIGRNGNLYYPSRGPGGRVQIMQLSPSGQTSVLATLPATTVSGKPLLYLNGLAAGADGSLYFTENDAIRRISMQGQVSTVVADLHLDGCASIPGTTANDHPLLRGLEVDARGVIYVAASSCGRVLKITPDGQVSTLAQTQSPWSPTAVARFGSDVYVLEYLHTAVESRRDWLPRVRKISPDGKTVIVATVDRR